MFISFCFSQIQMFQNRVTLHTWRQKIILDLYCTKQKETLAVLIVRNKIKLEFGETEV